MSDDKEPVIPDSLSDFALERWIEDDGRNYSVGASQARGGWRACRERALLKLAAAEAERDEARQRESFAWNLIGKILLDVRATLAEHKEVNNTEPCALVQRASAVEEELQLLRATVVQWLCEICPKCGGRTGRRQWVEQRKIETELQQTRRELEQERASHEAIANLLLPIVGTGDGTSVSAARRAAKELEQLRASYRAQALYPGRASFDLYEVDRFQVTVAGHVIAECEDSEVADFICGQWNATLANVKKLEKEADTNG